MIVADVVVIGAGIVGLATAWQLLQLQPRLKILVIEKAQHVAAHQTGHNSGVLHSGIYYKPGSLKAINCRQGKLAMIEFCKEYGIPYELCGKVIVALDSSELESLHKIFARGTENGVACRMIEREELKELEPHVAGVQAIHVPEAGIVDYREVARQLQRLLEELGQQVLFNQPVKKVVTDNNATHRVVVTTDTDEFRCRLAVNCCGLHSDRVSALAGLPTKAKIIPFRGEYFKIDPLQAHLCRNLIYPVPDIRFPFLGVHFTRMISGEVECGPNAVLAFVREGYRKRDIRLRDLSETLAFPGFWKFGLKHWRMGCAEMWRSVSKRAFVRALQRLIPEIQASHLSPAPAGVRAQAMLRNGQLVDDFLIEENEHIINVLNAPSPAATASLNIGQTVAERVVNRLDS